MTNERAAAEHRSVIHSFDLWSVAKVTLPLCICVVAAVVGVVVLLWGSLVGSGSIDEFEQFVVDTGYSSFEFVPSEMFAAVRSSGLILVAVGTVFTVVMAAIFNLLSGILGGVQVDTIDKPRRRHRGRTSD